MDAFILTISFRLKYSTNSVPPGIAANFENNNGLRFEPLETSWEGVRNQWFGWGISELLFTHFELSIRMKWAWGTKNPEIIQELFI